MILICCHWHRMSLEEFSQPLLEMQLHSSCWVRWARPSLCRTRSGLQTPCFTLANCGQTWSCGTSPLSQSTPDRFFTHQLMVWMPYHLWKVRVSCPACGKQLKGYGVHKRARKVLDIDTTWWWQRHSGALCSLKHLSTSKAVWDQLDLQHQKMFRCPDPQVSKAILKSLYMHSIVSCPVHRTVSNYTTLLTQL